jgi:hypothetical protein
MKKNHTFITSTVLASLVFVVPAWSKPQPIVKKGTITKAKKQIKSTKKANPIKKIVSITPVFVEQSQDIQQIARWVVPGQYNCFGQKTITLTPRTDYLGYVDVQQNGKTHLFLAVASNTGAVRLENKAANLFWLQLSVKSMLFNSQIGSRVLDDCQPQIPPADLKVSLPLLNISTPLPIVDTPETLVIPAVKMMP